MTDGSAEPNRKPKRSARASYDRPLARRLWQVSAELTGTAEEALQ